MNYVYYIITTINELRRNFDYVFFSTGIMTETCIRIANKLKSLGKSCVVIHLHTIKPLDEQLILKYTRIAKRIVIVEEHSVVGGLFSEPL